MKSNEMFYIDQDGKKQDKGLHEPILDNEEADLYSRRQSYERSVAEGMDEQAARRIFGIPS